MARGGKRLGAGRKRGGQNDPGKALVKAADKIAAELAIAITGDVAALGKDRLTELDNMAMQLVKLFAPKKDEHGSVHWGPGDEARFYRAVAMAGKYAEARAPYESPRLAAIAAANLNPPDADDDGGIDPYENIKRIIEGWIEAEKAEGAEKMMIDVTPVPEPAAPEIKPNPDDEGIDGEMAWIVPSNRDIRFVCHCNFFAGVLHWILSCSTASHVTGSLRGSHCG